LDFLVFFLPFLDLYFFPYIITISFVCGPTVCYDTYATIEVQLTHKYLPQRGHTLKKLTQKDLKRFWSRIQKRGRYDCWTSTSTPSAPYGMIAMHGRTWLAHRLSVWIHRPRDRKLLERGDPVLHQCDNPRCVNPMHLVVATQRQNVREMIQKGRWRWNTR
jgi:hypothetical protein